jgi:uncharacterized protein GlcG (DUF336 family)
MRNFFQASFRLLHPSGLRRLCIVCLGLLVVSCGGGGGSVFGSLAGGGCSFFISSQPQSLTMAEVELVLARAVSAANNIPANIGGPRLATIAVTDRVGNVLGVYRMTGASTTVRIRSGRTLSMAQGLEEALVPSELGAIAKAITGAYLSSSGNAFSTRTASFIVQEHLPPAQPVFRNFPSGPLFGVQFSSLPCGDFVQRGDTVAEGPKRTPLGLSADAGGFPLYKNGRVVGGIGVIADGIYGLDLDSTTTPDIDIDEIIAASAAQAFAAPDCIRANFITLGGPTPGYSDSDARLVASTASTLTGLNGALLAVTGYTPAAVRAGTAYGDAASGYVAAQTPASLVTRNAFVLVTGGAPRHPPINSTNPAVMGMTGGLTAAEVTEILSQALGVANQARAQIRRPVNSAAEVTVSVVDNSGNILGIARTPDAPIFGTDVSLQKARTAAFFSSTGARARLTTLQPSYVTDSDTFFGGMNIFSNGTAFSARAIGNIARPFFPDGIDANAHGPLSKPITTWSPFNVGLQLDLVTNRLLNAINNPNDAGETNCSVAGGGADALRNGIQIFPGSVPIYRNGTLIGAIGISGDGVDQDDMVAFLGLARAGMTLGAAGISNAPGMRADNLSLPGFPGESLRYVQCPQAPFITGTDQNVCAPF